MFRNPFMLRWPTSPDDDAPPRQQGETPEQARERRRLQRQLLPLPPGGAYVCLDDTKTWQLESLPPDGLARIVCEAREERLDRDAYLGVIVEGEGGRVRKCLLGLTVKTSPMTMAAIIWTIPVAMARPATGAKRVGNCGRASHARDARAVADQVA